MSRSAWTVFDSSHAVGDGGALLRSQAVGEQAPARRIRSCAVPTAEIAATPLKRVLVCPTGGLIGADTAPTVRTVFIPAVRRPRVESILVVAIGLFVLTNLDTLLVTVAFSLDDAYATTEILIGYSVGVVVGLLGALVGGALAAEVLRDGAFLLGVVPLGLGLWGLVRRRPETSDPGASSSTTGTRSRANRRGRIGLVSVTAIGLNGENLAVYVPFFAGLNPTERLVVVAVYLLAAAVLFLVALGGARLAGDTDHPAWIDRWIVPTVLVFVGGYVLVSGWLAA